MASVAKDLNAQFHGSGDTIVVLSHGMGSNQNVWRFVMPMLVQHFTIVTYDLACAGTVAPKVFDLRHHGALEGYAEDLLALMNELQISKCHFVGHSVSGMIGILASERSPERFHQLITIGASPRYLDDGLYRGGFTRANVADIFDAIGHNFHDWAKTFGPFAVGRDPDHPASQAFTDSLMTMRPDIALATARTIFLGDWRDRLAACDVPVILVQPQDDPAVPIAVADYLHGRLQHSRLEIIETNGHLPQLSVPDMLGDVLLRNLPIATE